MAIESPEVAEELSWPPVTHLLVHQQLADALLFEERERPN
jgi:hypothetical protein